MSKPYRWLVLAVVVTAQFMDVVDAFIVNVALPSVRSDLHATAGEMEAVLSVYQIAFAAIVATGGRLGDMYGRRRLFVAGVLGFTLASLWCGLSRSGPELVLARLAQGSVAALMVPQVLATVHVLFPEGDTARGRAFAVFGVALGAGGAVGVALGGWLVELNVGGLGWRSVFLVNLAPGLAVAAGAAWLMPASEGQRGLRLDLTGAGLLLLGLLALIGPVLAGQGLGWPWWLWATMAAGLLLLAVFLWMEGRVERRGDAPLVPSALLHSRDFLRGLAMLFSFQLGNVSFYLFVSLLLQGQLGFSVENSGLALVPLALAFIVGAQLSGRWTGRDGVRVMLWGCAVQSCSLLAFGVVAGLYGDALPAVLAVFGFGQGLVVAPLAAAVLANVPSEHAGSASGLLNMVQQASGALGVPLVGMIYLSGCASGRCGMVPALGFLLATVMATALLLVELRRRRASEAPA